jgi:gliding motility-associated-like protein
MKTTSRLLFIASIFILYSCSKTEDNTPPVPVFCEGLVTDTAGTNDPARVYFPNAFTPNSDGLNDVSKPVVSGISAISFTIYDLNSNVVFTTNQLNEGWHTTIVANSSVQYYFKIQATTTSNHKIGFCGDLYKLSCKPASAPTLYFEDQLTANGFTGTTAENLSVCP